MPKLSFKKGHEVKLRKTLFRLGLWESDRERLPNPVDIKSGVAGVSCLYFVFLPYKNDQGRYIVAKFDKKERRDREWYAITKLSKLNTIPGLMLPISGTIPEDNLIIYDAADGISDYRKCKTLKELFLDQIATNPLNCINAIRKLFEVLDPFYSSEPGASRHAIDKKLVSWKNVFRGLSENAVSTRSKIINNLNINWPIIDWINEKHFSVKILNFSSRTLPNPYYYLDNELMKPTNKIIFSRIHGDLNLTNAIVSLKGDHSVQKCFIIDISHCEPKRALAFDFARFESEVIRNILSKFSLSEEEIITGFISCRDYLDGRDKYYTNVNDNEFQALLKILIEIRQIAFSYLKPRKIKTEIYLLEDYYKCLYFHSLNILKHDTVLASEITSKLIILNAALSLSVLEDIRKGAFVKGTTKPRYHIPKKKIKKNISTKTISTSDNYRVLKKIERLSYIAFKDAEWIDEIKVEDALKDIRLSNQLYVKRSIENDIFYKGKFVHEGENKFVIIVGEAGFGKTSILWNLYRDINSVPDTKVFLVKASYLFLDHKKEYETKQVNPNKIVLDELVITTNICNRKKYKPVFLFDTVDLLLHDEANRNRFLEIVFTLIDLNVRVIATTRPQEAIFLKQTNASRFDLRDYDEKEMESAITKHSIVFYHGRDKYDKDEQINRISNAVSSGRPIREVCTNPLTLRMLFTLYAPNEVTLEINVFQLYVNYWKYRVCEDKRGGSVFSKNNIDLSITAGRSALLMLSEGSPELRSELFINVYSKDIFPNIKQLENRNILHRSESDTIRFFHQTFFEHSAARGMLQVFGYESIEKIERRLSDNPNDLFIFPIFEHLLLLCETEKKMLRLRSEETLKRLLLSKNLQKNISGIYVYIHKSSVSREINDIALSLIKNGDVAITKRFLDIAANIHKERHNNLFPFLVEIWKRGSWQEKLPLLHLLDRLVYSKPKEVYKFMTNNLNLSLISSFPPLLNEKYLDIIYKLNTIKDPKTSNLKELFSTICTIDEEALLVKLTNCVTNIVLETAQIEGFTLFFNTFNEECKNDSTEISVAMGKLFSVIWKIQELEIEQIVNNCESIKGFHYKWGLYSIAFILEKEDEGSLNYCWDYYLNIENTKNQFLWAHIIIPPLIEKTQEKNTSKILVKLQDFYVNCITSRTNKVKNKKSKSYILQQLIIAINISQIESSSFLYIFKSKIFDDPNIWLSKNFLGSLLPKGLFFSHKGAVEASKQFFVDPKKYDKQISSHLCNEISEWKIENLIFFNKAIELLIYMDDTVRLRRLITNNQMLFKMIGTEIKKKIVRYKNRLVSSKSSKDRLSGLYLWIQIIEFKVKDLPTINFIKKMLNKESDRKVIGAYAQLISYSCNLADFKFENLFEIFSKYATDNNQNVREKSIKALMNVLFSMQNVEIKYIDLMFDITINKNINTNLLKSFGFLIEKYLDDRVELSVYIFERLITSQEINRMTNYSKRSFVNIMRKPARRLFSMIDLDSRERIINLVPSTDPKIGRIIIDAACYEYFEQHIIYLNGLLNDKNVNSEIKNQILYHKHYRERTVGSEGWPELIEEVIV